MRTLAVLEIPKASVSPGIPFYPGETNEYLDQYVPIGDYEKHFTSLFESFHRHLESLRKQEAFRYRGVDLLWCFKKDIFDYADYCLQRYEAVKRLLTMNTGASVVIQKISGNGGPRPYLFPILQSGKLKEDPRVRFEGAVDSPHGSGVRNNSASLKSLFWPAKLARVVSKKPEAVIYSDFQRSKSVLRCLERHKSLFYTTSRAPRLCAVLWKGGYSFVQHAFPERERKTYENRAEQILHRIEDAAPFRGLLFGDVDAEDLLMPRLRTIMKDALPCLMRGIDDAHEFFETHGSLRTALLDEDITYLKNAFCQVASQHSVTSYVECHGALGFKNGFLPMTADYLCVWGNAQKKKLVRWGAQPEKVLVTGCSRYEHYRRLDAASVRRRVARKYRLDVRKPVVLVGLHPIEKMSLYFENTVQERIDGVLEALRNITSAQFIIKLHPGDRYKPRYMEWLTRPDIKTRVVVVEKEDPMLLARAADCLLVYLSTYALDGLAMGKNVLLVKDRLRSPIEEVESFGAFYEISELSDLEPALRAVLEKPGLFADQRREVERECLNFGSGELPEQRIAKLLADPVSRRSSAERNA